MRRKPQPPEHRCGMIFDPDMRFIFKAAAHAQRAADYLRAFSGGDGTTVITDIDNDAEARAA
jgi:antirestriction protein ArdC